MRGGIAFLKALRAKSRSEAETTEDGSTRWFAVVAGVSPAKPKCCGRYNCRSSEPYCSRHGCLYNQNFVLKRREGTGVASHGAESPCCLRATMHERLDTARRLQRQAAQEVSRVSCDRPAAAGRTRVKARNSRVASRVPGYFFIFCNFLTYSPLWRRPRERRGTRPWRRRRPGRRGVSPSRSP